MFFPFTVYGNKNCIIVHRPEPVSFQGRGALLHPQFSFFLQMAENKRWSSCSASARLCGGTSFIFIDSAPVFKPLYTFSSVKATNSWRSSDDVSACGLKTVNMCLYFFFFISCFKFKTVQRLNVLTFVAASHYMYLQFSNNLCFTNKKQSRKFRKCVLRETSCRIF